MALLRDKLRKPVEFDLKVSRTPFFQQLMDDNVLTQKQILAVFQIFKSEPEKLVKNNYAMSFLLQDTRIWGVINETFERFKHV